MKKVKLNTGQFALVDNEDFQRVNQHKWHVNTRGYVIASIGGRPLSMHRFVMGQPHCSVDHRYGDKLDNRKRKLRLCNQSQNCGNAKRSINNTSGFKGVSWNKALKKWHSYIMVNRKRKHLGYFVDKLEAAKTYNRAALEYFGEFAKLNEVKL